MAPAARSRSRPTITGGVGEEVEAEYAGDDWDARRLGIPARRGRERAHFGVIHQRWLREPIKRWARFRLSTGYAFTTVDASTQALRRFSLFLEQRHPDVDGITGISRDLLVEHLSWMASSQWATTTRSSTLTFLKMFLEWGRRHGTLPGLPADAVIYEEEVSRPGDALPKFIPEFVMAQLESEASLARLRNPTVRHLVIVLMETGMRGGDACELAFSPMVDDSVGWPCLRFANSKVSTEQLIPLNAKAAETIRSQQAHVRMLHPGGSPWLFPGIMDNADGAKPYAHGTLSGQLGRWQKIMGVRDEAGQPVRVHAHQFRHTVGTRLINAGVPQHVIQKLLGHASPRMTARYAQIHDHTVRDAFERYCRQRVNTDGTAVPYDPGALTADAEWVKHNLSRVRDSLPNGYCGRPPQQDCPHPQRLPHLPGLPDDAGVPRRPPRPGDGKPKADRPGRRQRPVPFGREPAPGPGQPRPHHPVPRSTRGDRSYAVTRADNSHHLAVAAAERHDSARRRATVAIEHLDRCGEAVTFSGVAVAAGVSRGWLYRQDDLRAAIIRLRPTASRPVTSGAANQRASIDSLRQRLEATRAEVAQLRAENTGLRDQVARSFGEQRARR